MFFITTDRFRFAHELVGIGFVVAIVLQLATLQAVFLTTLSLIIAVTWVVGIILLIISATRTHEDAEELIYNDIAQTSVQRLVSIFGLPVNELVDHLSEDGFVVEDPQISIEEIAEKQVGLSRRDPNAVRKHNAHTAEHGK